MSDEREIIFNRLRVTDETDTIFPVWGILERRKGKFNSLLVLDQEEAAGLQTQINERFRLHDLVEADIKRAELLDTIRRENER